MLILSLFYILLYCLLASECIYRIGSSHNFWSDRWDISVHADVAEVSQEYLCATRKLHDKPRKLLFATGFGRAKRLV